MIRLAVCRRGLSSTTATATAASATSTAAVAAVGRQKVSATNINFRSRVAAGYFSTFLQHNGESEDHGLSSSNTNDASPSSASSHQQLDEGQKQGPPVSQNNSDATTQSSADHRPMRSVSDFVYSEEDDFHTYTYMHSMTSSLSPPPPVPSMFTTTAKEEGQQQDPSKGQAKIDGDAHLQDDGHKNIAAASSNTLDDNHLDKVEVGSNNYSSQSPNWSAQDHNHDDATPPVRAFHIFNNDQAYTVETLRQRTVVLASPTNIAFGKFTPVMWKEAIFLLKLWTKYSDVIETPESVDQSFALLDRLVLEQEVQHCHELSLQQLNTRLVRYMLHNWNRCIRNFHSHAREDQALLRYEYTPMEVLARLESYSDRSPRLQFDTISLNMILDGAGRCHQCSPTGIPGMISARVATSFAQSLFDRMVGTLPPPQHDHRQQPVHQQNVNDFDRTTADNNHARKNNKQDGRITTPPSTEQIMMMDMMVPQQALDRQGSDKDQDGVPPMVADPHRFRHRLPPTRPDIKTYASIIRLFASMGLASRAEALLNRLYKEYQKTKHQQLEPDVEIFTTVLMAWARSNAPHAPERAEALLKNMQELSDCDIVSVAPDCLAYNAVLKCWVQAASRKFRQFTSKENQEAAKRYQQRAVDLFSFMEQSGHIDAISYNIIIHSFQQRGMPGEAENILQRMHRAAANGATKLRPNSSTYGTVLSAWSKSQNPNCGDRAEEILKTYEQQYLAGNVADPPNIIIYNSVLACLAQAKEADRAEKLLERMKNTKDNAHDGIISPDAISYNTVINAHGRAKNPHKAEALLEAMYQEYLSTNGDNLRIQPDIKTFSTVLNAWLKSNEPYAAKRAQDILETMEKLSAAGILPVAPNCIAYNTVQACWCKSNDTDAAERALEILDKMESQYNAGNSDVRPDELNYSNVITAFAKRQDPRRAEELLERMRYQSLPAAMGGRGNSRARPTENAYRKVLGAYYRANDEDSAERAGCLYKRWEERFANGELQDPPCFMATKLVMLAWRRAAESYGNSAAGTQASAILKQYERTSVARGEPTSIILNDILLKILSLVKDATNAHTRFEWMCDQAIEGDTSLIPNQETFDLVLATLWSSGSPDAPNKAAYMFQKVQELSDSEVVPWKPSTDSYRIFLGCLEENPSLQSGLRANMALKEMEKQYQDSGRSRSKKPLSRDYAQVIRLWSRVDDREAGRLANVAFQKMKALCEAGDDKYKPDANVYRDIIGAWTRSGDAEAAENVLMLEDEMERLQNQKP